MKRKYSLNRLLHNNKLMMAVSVILAVVIWVMVVYDSNNIETRTISNVTANLDLANTYAGNDGLVIFEGASQQVDVSVSGPRGVIYKLSASDVLITCLLYTSHALTAAASVHRRHARQSGRCLRDWG